MDHAVHISVSFFFLMFKICFFSVGNRFFLKVGFATRPIHLQMLFKFVLVVHRNQSFKWKQWRKPKMSANVRQTGKSSRRRRSYESFIQSKWVQSGQRGHLFPPVFSEHQGSLNSKTCNISLVWKCMHIELNTPRKGTLPLALQPS